MEINNCKTKLVNMTCSRRLRARPSLVKKIPAARSSLIRAATFRPQKHRNTTRIRQANDRTVLRSVAGGNVVGTL